MVTFQHLYSVRQIRQFAQKADFDVQYLTLIDLPAVGRTLERGQAGLKTLESFKRCIDAPNKLCRGIIMLRYGNGVGHFEFIQKSVWLCNASVGQLKRQDAGKISGEQVAARRGIEPLFPG